MLEADQEWNIEQMEEPDEQNITNEISDGTVTDDSSCARNDSYSITTQPTEAEQTRVEENNTDENNEQERHGENIAVKNEDRRVNDIVNTEKLVKEDQKTEIETENKVLNPVALNNNPDHEQTMNNENKEEGGEDEGDFDENGIEEELDDEDEEDDEEEEEEEEIDFDEINAETIEQIRSIKQLEKAIETVEAENLKQRDDTAGKFLALVTESKRVVAELQEISAENLLLYEELGNIVEEKDEIIDHICQALDKSDVHRENIQLLQEHYESVKKTIANDNPWE